jgi:hypothetical protein
MYDLPPSHASTPHYLLWLSSDLRQYHPEGVRTRVCTLLFNICMQYPIAPYPSFAAVCAASWHGVEQCVAVAAAVVRSAKTRASATPIPLPVSVPAICLKVC